MMKSLTWILVVVAAVCFTLGAGEPQFGRRFLKKKAAFLKGVLIGSAIANSHNRRFNNYGNYGFNNYRHGNKFYGGYNKYNQGFYHKPHYYHKREVSDNDQLYEQMEDLFLQASVNDADDCIKSFVCQSAAKPAEARDELEAQIDSVFAGPLVLSGDVEFRVAAAIGQASGSGRCSRIYARCATPYQDIKQTLQEETLDE